MPTDIIEMHWGCTNAGCKADNLGRHKTCQNCGKPRTKDAREWLPSDISHEAAVKDPVLLKKAKAGRDWECRFCKSTQFRADGNCAQCGSPQEQSRDSKPPVAYAAPQTAPASSGRRRKYTTVDRAEASVTARKFALWPVFVGVGVLSFVLVLYILFRTKDFDATVASVSWERSVKIERHEKVHDSGWQVPSGAENVNNLGSRVYDHEKVAQGTHQEAYEVKVKCGQTCETVKGKCTTTPRNCKSNGNGFATCTGGDKVCTPDTKSCVDKMCPETRYRDVPTMVDRPIYRDWYEWDVWEWHYNRTVSSRGNTTTDVAWPGEKQMWEAWEPGTERVESRSETYSVLFSARESYTYHPTSEAEFKTFKVGDQHRLKVGTAHGVSILR